MSKSFFYYLLPAVLVLFATFLAFSQMKDSFTQLSSGYLTFDTSATERDETPGLLSADDAVIPSTRRTDIAADLLPSPLSQSTPPLTPSSRSPVPPGQPIQPVSIYRMPGWPVLVSQTGGSVHDHLVADVDNDGTNELVVSIARAPPGQPSIHVYDTTGRLKRSWSVPGRNVCLGLSFGNLAATLTTFQPAILTATENKVYAFDGSGNTLSGWPVSIRVSLGKEECDHPSVTIADIDADGINEVIFDGDELYVFDVRGRPKTSWPKRIVAQYKAYPNRIAVADINLDGRKDIVIYYTYAVFSGQQTYYEQYVGVYDYRANLLPGWPRKIYTVSNNAYIWVYPPPVVGDVDSDRELEIVVRSPHDGRIHVLNHDGSAVAGWPKTFLPYTNPPVPSLGDIDADGKDEIVVNIWWSATMSGIHAFNGDGTLVPGKWPVRSYQYTMLEQPIMSDINNDGTLDILLLDYTIPLNNIEVHALRTSGDELRELRVPTDKLFRCPAFYNLPPSLADLDQDGLLDVILADKCDDKVYVWETTYRFNPKTLVWPNRNANVQRTGASRP